MMRRYLLVFSCPVLLVVAIATSVSIFFEPISGDLVRIGRWAERDFGGLAAQPVLAIKMNGVATTSPDILVLGDSFSRGNYWQSEISTKLNKKILSFHYDQVGCVNNWLQFALNDLSAKTIIVEVVERNFLVHFRELNPCKKSKPIPFELLSTHTSPLRAKWPIAVDLEYAFMAGKNSLKMNSNMGNSIRTGLVVNAPIKKTCANFSNRRSDRMLYLTNDEIKLDWNKEDVDEAVSVILRIQALFQARDKKLVFVVVPDKSTVYQKCLLGGGLETEGLVNITDQLIAVGINTPNVLRAFKINSSNLVDLYRPDDTHLSENGFVLLANEIMRFMAGVKRT